MSCSIFLFVYILFLRIFPFYPASLMLMLFFSLEHSPAICVLFYREAKKKKKKKMTKTKMTKRKKKSGPVQFELVFLSLTVYPTFFATEFSVKVAPSSDFRKKEREEAKFSFRDFGSLMYQ